MEAKTDIRLTSAEIGALWTTYMNDTLAVCSLKYFIEKVKDTDVKPHLEYALSQSEKHIKTIVAVFQSEGYPIPQGFTKEDVDLTAPPLYDDSFYLFYLHFLSRFTLEAYGVALSITARKDIVDFFRDGIYSSTELTAKVTETLLSKGLYVRAPSVTIPDKVDFINKKSFLTGFLGEKRSLSAIEIAHIYTNIQANVLLKALLKGYSQVAEATQVKEYMLKGTHICHKHSEILKAILTDEDIPAPTPSDTFVTNSKESPFSDKLIMFDTTILVAIGFSSDAIAISTSMRHDLQAEYLRLVAEIAQYGMEGINLMIEKGWMEQPPLAVNHKVLAGV